MKYIGIILILWIVLASCDVEIPTASVPEEAIANALAGSQSIPDEKLKLIEGIFLFSGTISQFGNNAVIKSSPGFISIFCKKNYSFMVLKAGSIGNRIIFAGYWRYAQSSDIGFINYEIDSAGGAYAILNNIKPDAITIRDVQTKKVVLTYSDKLKTTDFMIIGHRGGGRNIDRHPASENSLNMLKYSERLGCNGVEIDVRLTKDRVPVLFHDEYLSKRLIREDFFIGKVSDYSFSQLRSFVTLKNGELIPTLDEALSTIVRETTLKFIWLDVKADGLIPQIDKLIHKYQAIADDLGRKIEICAGIPDNDIFDEFMNYSNHEQIPSICELDEEQVLSAGSRIWAPRWSLGFLTDRVLAIQAKGKRVFVWTLDEEQFVPRFLGKSYFNGILTNYPAMVAYDYYTL